MSQIHKYRHVNGVCRCGIVPPYILDAIIKNGTPAQRASAQKTLKADTQTRALRASSQTRRPAAVEGVGPPHRNRLVHDAMHSFSLPGTLVRSEGDGPSGDVAVNEAYDGLGATFDLYYDIYGRNSIDDSGQDLNGTVHYGESYNNAFWDGTQMVFGDGDGTIFNRFTISIDVIGHELTHGVTGATAGLEYRDQSGALNESISDVFGSLVKQRFFGQTAAGADWLIGAGLLAAGINGVALRSMKAPGTAYDDPLLGKDPQPDHMNNYVNTASDNGGVHTNSGIPNKAFYLVATALGGYAWDVAGKIWYQALTDAQLSATAQFQDFANLTAQHAGQSFGSAVRAAVVQAWRDVGINVAGLTSPRLPAGGFVGAVSRSADKLDIFVSDQNGVIQTAAWEPAFSDWWHGWWELNGGRAAPGAPVHCVSRSTDKLDVFVAGTDARVYTAAWEPVFGDGWHGWWSLNGGVASLGAHVTVVSRNTDKLDAFVVGTDGRVYTAAWEPSFPDWWHGWWPIGDIRVPQGARVCAVSRSADKLDIFVTDINGVILTAAWEPAFTDGWHGWWPLNGGRAAPGAPVNAVSRSADKLDVFVAGTDGRVYTAAWEPSFPDWWHGWWAIGDIRVPQGAPVHAVSRSADKLDIFVTDVNGAILTAAWEPSFPDWWHGWWALNGGGAAPGAPVTAVSRSADKLDVFVVGNDGRVWTAAWEPSFPDWWHGWWPIGD
jgi:Thermolysin metallopeptidase, alpha-helical domain/Thermolysin metallopeptidase, catalytic domain/Protealysin propeptide